jgi:hypothetical protein
MLKRNLGNRAVRYARLSGLGHCIRADESPWVRRGLGYLVIDFPKIEARDIARSNQSVWQHLVWSWWTLMTFCGLKQVNAEIQRRYPEPADAERVRADLYGAQSRFVGAWRDPDALRAAVEAAVGEFDPWGCSAYVRLATREQWDADIALRRALRDILAFAKSAGLDPFAEAVADEGI